MKKRINQNIEKNKIYKVVVTHIPYGFFPKLISTIFKGSYISDFLFTIDEITKILNNSDIRNEYIYSISDLINVICLYTDWKLQSVSSMYKHVNTIELYYTITFYKYI